MEIINRYTEFKRTDIGSFLSEKFPGITDSILISMENDEKLPRESLIREQWNLVDGISFDDKINFEELMIFYSFEKKLEIIKTDKHRFFVSAAICVVIINIAVIIAAIIFNR